MWTIENDLNSVWWIGIDLVFVKLSKTTFSVRIEISGAFVSGHRKWLDIRVGIKMDLISVMGSTLTWFLLRDQN